MCHAVIVANHDTATLINWATTARHRNTSASDVSRDAGAPWLAWSMIRRTTSGPASDAADASATSSPRPIQRRASGRSSAPSARQREVPVDMPASLTDRAPPALPNFAVAMVTADGS